jgi:hypothetical protein
MGAPSGLKLTDTVFGFCTSGLKIPMKSLIAVVLATTAAVTVTETYRKPSAKPSLRPCVIDQKVFAERMSMIYERFGRNPSKPVSAAYYQALSNSLTTQEFVTAAQRIFVENTFFPSPAEFVDKAKGKVEDAAQLEWMEVMAAIAKDRKFQLSESGKAALEVIGGRWAVRNTENVSFLRKDFIAAFVAHERRDRAEKAAPALPSGALKELAENVIKDVQA